MRNYAAEIGAYKHGRGVSSVHYVDGSVRILHLCKDIQNDGIIIGPDDSRLVSRRPLLLSSAITCDACGLDGRVVNDVWTLS